MSIIDPLVYCPLPASLDLGGRFTNWPSAKVSYCLVYIFGEIYGMGTTIMFLFTLVVKVEKRANLF